MSGSEMLRDGTIGGEEALGLPGGLEPLHPPLALASRLMRVFRAIVEVPVLAVFHAGQHLPLRGRIAFQPVGDDDSRDVPTGFEQLPKKPLGGCFVAATLYQNIEDMAILIHRPPEVVPLPMNREKDLIEMPFVPQPGTMAPELIGILLAELQAPLSDRLI